MCLGKAETVGVSVFHPQDTPSLRVLVEVVDFGVWFSRWIFWWTLPWQNKQEKRHETIHQKIIIFKGTFRQKCTQAKFCLDLPPLQKSRVANPPMSHRSLSGPPGQKVWKKSPGASGPGVPKSLEKVSKKSRKSPKSLE